MPPSQISVLDLTARIGVSALEQLGVPGVTGHGSWTDMPLAQVARAPRIDWHRPRTTADLSALNPSPAALAILVGPGCLPLLPAVLDQPSMAGAPAVWFFLMPNAEGLFLYLVLDRAKGNLALARYKLTDVERSLKV